MNRIQLNEPTPIYYCSTCWLNLIQDETEVERVLFVIPVRRCKWCGSTVGMARCSFDGCDRQALQLDWDRIQDIEVPFCLDHCYNGKVVLHGQTIREQLRILSSDKKDR